MNLRTISAAATAVALGVAMSHLPGELRRWDNRAAVARSWSRHLPAASELGIDPAAFDRAASLMPRDTVFYVATPKGSALPALAFPNLAAGTLLPRRRTLELHRAQWVLAYRVDPRQLGVPVRRVVRLAQDVEAAQLR